MGAMEAEPGRLFQRATVDFIYVCLPMFLLLILKSFLHDCISLAGVPKRHILELHQQSCREETGLCAGLLAKSCKCGTRSASPLLFTVLRSLLSKVPSTSSSLCISAASDIDLQTPRALQCVCWTFSPRAVVTQTIK